MQLWVAVRGDRFLAAVAAWIINHPLRKSYSIPFIGGRELRSWVRPMRATLEAYARAHGCDLMEGGARRGWARIAGFKEAGVWLIREL